MVISTYQTPGQGMKRDGEKPGRPDPRGADTGAEGKGAGNDHDAIPVIQELQIIIIIIN